MKKNLPFDKTSLWFFILFFAFLMGMVFSYTPYRLGDGSEYIMTTESLVYDHDLVYDEDVDLPRTLERKPVTMDTPAGLSLMKRTRDGKVRFGLHSFYYPLASAPFYLVFSVFGKSFSYFGFYFFNAILFFGCVLMGFMHLKDKMDETGALIFSALFFLLSAAMTYVFWIHSETLILFLVTAYLFFWHKKRYLVSAIFIGFAAGIKLPILALLLPFWYELVIERKELKKTVLCLFITIAILSPQIYYNLSYLGALNAVVRVGASKPEFITFSTVIGSFISPFYGLLWFYPMVVVALINMEGRVKNYLLLFSALIIMTAMNSTGNLASHQVGLRYLMFIYPLFLFITREVRLKTLNMALTAIAALLIAGVVINPINNAQIPPPTSPWQFTYLPYKASRYILHLRDNPETTFYYNRIKGGRNIAYIGEESRVEGTSWLEGDKWIRFLIRNTKEGEIILAVNGWPREVPQKLTARINEKKEYHFSIQPGRTNVLRIPIFADDIYHYSNRPVRDLVYLDIFTQAWKPSEVFSDSTDSRNYGIAPVAILNNNDLLLGTPPPPGVIR